MTCELASRCWRRTFLYMWMSQKTTDKSQMLSRLSHVDEVQYKRWNHYKVHQALKTWVTFRRHLEFSPWSQVSLKEGCLGEGGWGGEGLERQGEVVGISLNGGRFESFVFFCFGFYFRMPILSWTLSFRPFSKYGSILKTFKTIRGVLTFTRSVENPTDDKLTHVD